MKQTFKFWSLWFILVPLFQWGTFSIFESHVQPFQEAIPININTAYYVTIESPGQMKYYRLSPTSTSTYTLSSTGILDTVGSLYNSSYELITTDDDTGPSLNFTITRLLQFNSDYYLVVKLYRTNTTGSFSIIITKN